MSIRDEIVKCPFDEHHRVSRARFPVHLIKCRKQHRGQDFSICPYNATHYVLTPEFQFHLDNCQDRKTRQLVTPNDTYRPRARDIELPPPNESWDDEEDTVSYLDVKDNLIAKLPVLRTPSGMTKAERKKFMRQEVHRFHNLNRAEASASRKSEMPMACSDYDEQSVENNPSNTIEDPLPEVADDEDGEFYVVRRRGSHRRANM